MNKQLLFVKYFAILRAHNPNTLEIVWLFQCRKITLECEGNRTVLNHE